MAARAAAMVRKRGSNCNGCGLDNPGRDLQIAFMQSQNPIIADLVKLANSAAGTMAGMSREARDGARERLREAFGGIDFVSREEFDTVKAMAQKAREQADALEARLAALETKLSKK
jgi:BMFP domain-containing protein YqiC